MDSRIARFVWSATWVWRVLGTLPQPNKGWVTFGFPSKPTYKGSNSRNEPPMFLTAIGLDL